MQVLTIALFVSVLFLGGLNIEGEDDSWDFGSGAGFYVDATADRWKKYRMYSFVTEELPEVVANNFPADTSRMSIMGHRQAISKLLICVKCVLIDLEQDS